MNAPIRRRDVLKGGALLAATSVLPAAGKRDLHKAIMYETIKIDGSVLAKFQAVKAAGFEGVEPNSHMDQAEVLAALQATGLKAASVCCSIHSKYPLSHPDPAIRAEGVRGVEQTLRDAKAYGATSILLIPARVNASVSYADAYSRSQTELRKLLPVAHDLGVKIAIEDVWNHFLMSPLEAARYIDEFQSDAIGWHFDIGNVVTDGWPEQWIRILNKRILKLHVKEYSRRKRDTSGPGAGFDVKFLEGDNNWPAIMQALDEIGYKGWGIAEQPGGDSPQGLLDLSTRMDRIFAS